MYKAHSTMLVHTALKSISMSLCLQPTSRRLCTVCSRISRRLNRHSRAQMRVNIHAVLLSINLAAVIFLYKTLTDL